MRDIRSIPIAISTILAEDEKLCKEISAMMATNMAGEISEKEITLRARLRQIRATLKDCLDAEKQFGVPSIEEKDEEERE